MVRVSTGLKPFLSDARVKALLEINLQKLNLLPRYEKFEASLSPAFDRFHVKRFQAALLRWVFILMPWNLVRFYLKSRLSLKEESQPKEKTFYNAERVSREAGLDAFERKSMQLIRDRSQFMLKMLKKIKTENEDYNQLMLLCEVNTEQQKLLKEMLFTYETYRKSRIEKYLDRVSKWIIPYHMDHI